MGQEVAARWRNTNHYLATVIELFTGETTSLSKADKDVKQNERDSEPTNIKSVPADVEETINGEKSKGKAGPLKKAQKPAKVIEKKKNKKTKNKKPVTNEDGGSDDSSEEINVIEVDVKKKKKEIEAEKKKNKEAVMAASQQVAASLFSKKTIEIGPSDVIPDNFHLLAPGASIAVNTLWLHDILSSLTKQRQKREKKADKKGLTIREDRNVEILKRLMDGFFDPWDLAVEGGTASFKDNAVFNALQLYATHHLKMSIPVFKKAGTQKWFQPDRLLKDAGSKEHQV
ncbi:uncharacterized protein LOC123566663 isoform X1 [Mercenaria mercenaria]|uniref:uncharacterized protein LOC123566663 isoform X1 n=1 Tax=Mercenaria mercenaria TaxID=6596 RepID=UPI00234F5FC2|nr:uncharacterized protein LOC123566663 isoform X1 [Mercenaria mercenaria]